MNAQTTKALASLFKVAALDQKTPLVRNPKKEKPKTAARAPARQSEPLRQQTVRRFFNLGSDAVIKVDTDSKGLVTMVPRPLNGERDMARSIVGMKPFKSVLTQSINVASGSANTAYAPVFPADITLANNWSNWRNLFDEVKIDRAQVTSLHQLTTSTLNVVCLPYNCWIMSCDLEDPNPATSVANELAAPYHSGPFTMGGNSIVADRWGATTGSGVNLVGCSNGTGTMHLRSPRLPGDHTAFNSGGVQSPNPVGGNWTACVSSSIVGCYFKYYFEAPGANITTSVRPFITYEATFRCRG